MRRRRGAFLCFDVNCNPGLEFHGEVVGEDGDFIDELFDKSLTKLCDVGFLPGDEVMQLLDLVHGFFPVMADELGLFFLVAKPEDQISQNAKVFIEEMKANKKEITVIEYPNAVHSFIESNNPEGLVGATMDMSEVVNEEQQNLERQAENEIYNWLLSH